jgi:hypothetical protein
VKRREGSQIARRVGLIKKAAKEMAKELNEHQCKLADGTENTLDG